MSSFVQRLRERKLVQWALAYAAAAWVLLQVLGLMAGTYHWSDAVMQIGFGVALLGFLVAVLLAWYHGERGEQRVTHMEISILAVLLAVGGGVLWRMTATRAPVAAVESAAPAVAAASVPAKSIAVLPFENLSADKDNEYFASGMQDMILGKLGEIGELAVASRTSTLKYKSRPDNLKAVARELGVAHILEGSVQKSGNQVLISLQLIDAVADQHRWAQSYRRTLDDIFGVEGEIAQTVADALKARLTGAESVQIAKVGTRNKDAYDLVLRGRYFLETANRTGDFANLERSIEAARKAIALDPNFVDAYILLALANDKLRRVDDAEPAARRALELEPDSAQAHRLMAYVLTARGDPDAALAHMREAVRLTPANPIMRLGLAFTLEAEGRVEEAIPEFERAIELEPSDDFYRYSAARADFVLRHYRRGLERVQFVIRRDPGELPSTALAAQIQRVGFGDLAASRATLEAATAPATESGVIATGWFDQRMLEREYAAALVAVQQAPQKWFDIERRARGEFVGRAERAQGHAAAARAAYLAARAEIEGRLAVDAGNADLHAHISLVLVGLGQADEALREAAQAQALNRVKGLDAGYLVGLARVQALTGHNDAAFASLDRLVGMPTGNVVSAALLRLDPDWDALRKDPRFDALVARYAQAERDAEP